MGHFARHSLKSSANEKRLQVTYRHRAGGGETGERNGPDRYKPRGPQKWVNTRLAAALLGEMVNACLPSALLVLSVTGGLYGRGALHPTSVPCIVCFI
jgi:hypothetical protein